MPWLLEHLEGALFHFNNTPVTPLTLLIFAGILFVTAVIARLVRRGVSHYFVARGKEYEGLSYALGRISQYTVFALGFIFALDNVGLDLAAFAGISAVFAVGIGFGMQNIAQNFISGIILLIERPVQKGDFIVVGDTVGTVVAIEMRATKVVSPYGVAVIVPNSELIGKSVLNQTSPTSRIRVGIKVGVAYGSKLDVVREALLEVAARHEQVLKDPAPAVLFRDFGDSAMEFELTVWLPHPNRVESTTSELRFATDRTFREKGIEIPFPQRELRLRS
jgi:potassium efflux system protein